MRSTSWRRPVTVSVNRPGRPGSPTGAAELLSPGPSGLLHVPSTATAHPLRRNDETIPTVSAPVHPSTDPSVRGAVDRLSAEFAGRTPAAVVDRIVRASRQDLDTVPVAALPELVERLARQRLIDTAAPRH